MNIYQSFRPRFSCLLMWWTISFLKPVDSNLAWKRSAEGHAEFTSTNRTLRGISLGARAENSDLAESLICIRNVPGLCMYQKWSHLYVIWHKAGPISIWCCAEFFFVSKRLHFVYMERLSTRKNRCFLASYKYSKLSEKFHSGTLDFRSFGHARSNNR